MKKIIAVLLALIIALSCAAVAFADNTAENAKKCGFCGQRFDNEEKAIAHEDVCVKNPNNDKENFINCPYCSQSIAEKSYNKHIEICYAQRNSHAIVTGDLSVAKIIDKLISGVEINANWWDAIEGVIIRFVDLVENTILFITGRAADKVAE